MKNIPQRILTNAIEQWQPANLVSLYSGGYDSAVTTHLLHRLDTHGLPIRVAAIDTQLAADGWHEYVTDVANKQGWDFKIYSSQKGWASFLGLVKDYGCPKSRKMHDYVFQKLKGRVIEAIHMAMKKDMREYAKILIEIYKSQLQYPQDKKSLNEFMKKRGLTKGQIRGAKTLFVSGMRRAESAFRKEAAEVERIGKSNRIFAAPIVYWLQEECDLYRIENVLPDNPFYNTIGGSGDCQCNWADFVTLRILQKYSPKLAKGNVALIDKISRDLHGFGWDSRDIESQLSFIKDVEPAILTEPFLCQGCSRAKIRRPIKEIEKVMLQRGLF